MSTICANSESELKRVLSIEPLVDAIGVADCKVSRECCPVKRAEVEAMDRGVRRHAKRIIITDFRSSPARLVVGLGDFLTRQKALEASNHRKIVKDSGG